jgi:hypothetical protein
MLGAPASLSIARGRYKKIDLTIYTVLLVGHDRATRAGRI